MGMSKKRGFWRKVSPGGGRKPVPSGFHRAQAEAGLKAQSILRHPDLLVAEGHDGVDLGGAAGREVGGGRGYR